jgi:multidrug efflux pump subunit AcrA (membrane-fusion protein)
MSGRVGLVGLLLLAACGGGGDDEAAPAAARVPVGIGVIARDSLIETLALTGRLEARPGGAALLAAPAAGIVRAVRAQVGDRVARGAVVVELEVPELAADAAQ